MVILVRVRVWLIIYYYIYIFPHDFSQKIFEIWKFVLLYCILLFSCWSVLQFLLCCTVLMYVCLLLTYIQRIYVHIDKCVCVSWTVITVVPFYYIFNVCPYDDRCHLELWQHWHWSLFTLAHINYLNINTVTVFWKKSIFILYSDKQVRLAFIMALSCSFHNYRQTVIRLLHCKVIRFAGFDGK